MSTRTNEFAEETKSAENVEILRGPAPLTVDGAVIGTCQITREAVLDYKTKQPTGEKLVYLVAAPGMGRAAKVRLSYATGAIQALGVVPQTTFMVKADDKGKALKDAPEIEVTAESVPALKDAGFIVVE